MGSTQSFSSNALRNFVPPASSSSERRSRSRLSPPTGALTNLTEKNYVKRATLEETAQIAVEYGSFLASKRSGLLQQIKLSRSRRNGFNMREEEDTVCEHWAWSLNNPINDYLQLQAINCSLCGEYVQVSDCRIKLSDRIRCHCYDYE